MSQPLIAARGATARALRSRAASPESRPSLRVVAPPAALAVRLPLPLLCVLLLTAGLVALLLMNIAIARDAFTLSELERESTLLAEQQQSVHEEIAAEAAPQALARSARELGMVPAPAPAHLSGGEVVGEPQEAVPAPAETTAPAGAAETTAPAGAAQPAGEPR